MSKYACNACDEKNPCHFDDGNVAGRETEFCSASALNEAKWVQVQAPEQFGNSEQLPEPQTEPINHVEMFRGFTVPSYHDLKNNVDEFNKGAWAYCSGEDCDGISCADCLFCCNAEYDKSKISAFAEYAKSKGYEITRPGCGEGTPHATTPGELTVRFKKLHPDAKVPYQATPGSAGFDLTATSKKTKKDSFLRYVVEYGTGLAVEIPKGYVGLLFPRSSIYKKDMLLTNGVGVIDSDYRGEIKAVFACVKGGDAYHLGDRICQLVIMPIPAIEFVEADELSATRRGAGGYGSTGK